MLLKKCVCGKRGGSRDERHGIPVHRCRCGIMRQAVSMTEAEYRAFYATGYLEDVYTHSLEQDRRVAELRLDAYRLEVGQRLLDLGAANGAFVRAANERGLDAWGQDLARAADSDRTYVGELADLNFPSAWADVITAHDVLEHVVDPNAWLAEVRRILRGGGELIVDFPRFHHESGAHHWKPIEHLWCLDDEQLVGLIRAAGFSIASVEHPIESKTVVRAIAPRVTRCRILVPPGIGDGYWVAAKLRGLLESRGIGPADSEIWVHDGGPRRAGELWSLLPFTTFGGYARVAKGPHLDAAYKPPGVAVQENVAGFDLFLSFNGTLEGGKSLDDALPGPTDWSLPLFHSKGQQDAEERFRERGPYIAAAFWDHGIYKSWLEQFGEAAILKNLRLLLGRGFRVVLMGAEWDRGKISSRLAKQEPAAEDMLGRTSFEELLALIRGASGVFGFPAGNTLLGPFLGRPTVLLWNGRFPRSFWTDCAPPDAPYTAVSTRLRKPSLAAWHLAEMLRR